jgi:hypothetical protein
MILIDSFRFGENADIRTKRGESIPPLQVLKINIRAGDD